MLNEYGERNNEFVMNVSILMLSECFKNYIMNQTGSIFELSHIIEAVAIAAAAAAYINLAEPHVIVTLPSL